MLIFLDIDGVMLSAASWKRPDVLEDGFSAFSSRATTALQSLIKEDTTIILTTSHKNRFTIEEWKGIFERRGIYLPQISRLAPNNDDLNRKEEILRWFATNQTGSFLIIDDDKSLNDLPLHLKKHLVLTNPLVGLTNEHLAQIEAILGSKSIQHSA